MFVQQTRFNLTKFARCRYVGARHPLKFLEALTNDIPDYSVRRFSNAGLQLSGYTDIYLLTSGTHGIASDTETRS